MCCKNTFELSFVAEKRLRIKTKLIINCIIFIKHFYRETSNSKWKYNCISKSNKHSSTYWRKAWSKTRKPRKFFFEDFKSEFSILAVGLEIIFPRFPTFPIFPSFRFAIFSFFKKFFFQFSKVQKQPFTDVLLNSCS